MIIPFPIRIPVLQALLFASLLVLVELLEGTDPLYSCLVFSFVMLSVFAFNIAGGFSRPSGAYIFFFSTLAVLVGTVYKALLGQAAQTNLEDPFVLMGAHNGLMVGILVAAYISRKVAPTKDGMAAVMHVRQLDFKQSAQGCIFLWAILMVGPQYVPALDNPIVHAINLVNPFLALGILFGTIGAVQRSHGRHSTSMLTLCCMGWIMFNGLMALSKQGMFTAPVTWLIGCAWARFRMRPRHIIFMLAFAIIAQTELVPLSAKRDDLGTLPPEVRFDRILHLLTHPSEFKSKEPYEPPNEIEANFHYYRTPQGIWDRMTMLPNDSVLVSFSDQGHYFGYKALRYYFENWVPHIIDPHKLEGVRVGGNAYMHEMSMLADDDLTTGISFSPTAEAFHIDGWFCIFCICPFIYIIVFTSIDAVCGDLRRQPWGLPIILGFAHVAPEAGLGGPIYTAWNGNIGTCIAIFGCGYITPLLSLLVSSGKRLREDHGFVPTPRNLHRPAL